MSLNMPFRAIGYLAIFALIISSPQLAHSAENSQTQQLDTINEKLNKISKKVNALEVSRIPKTIRPAEEINYLYDLILRNEDKDIALQKAYLARYYDLLGNMECKESVNILLEKKLLLLRPNEPIFIQPYLPPILNSTHSYNLVYDTLLINSFEPETASEAHCLRGLINDFVANSMQADAIPLLSTAVRLYHSEITLKLNDIYSPKIQQMNYSDRDVFNQIFERMTYLNNEALRNLWMYDRTANNAVASKSDFKDKFNKAIEFIPSLIGQINNNGNAKDKFTEISLLLTEQFQTTLKIMDLTDIRDSDKIITNLLLTDLKLDQTQQEIKLAENTRNIQLLLKTRDADLKMRGEAANRYLTNNKSISFHDDPDYMNLKLCAIERRLGIFPDCDVCIIFDDASQPPEKLSENLESKVARQESTLSSLNNKIETLENKINYLETRPATQEEKSAIEKNITDIVEKKPHNPQAQPASLSQSAANREKKCFDDNPDAKLVSRINTVHLAVNDNDWKFDNLQLGAMVHVVREGTALSLALKAYYDYRRFIPGVDSPENTNRRHSFFLALGTVSMPNDKNTVTGTVVSAGESYDLQKGFSLSYGLSIYSSGSTIATSPVYSFTAGIILSSELAKHFFNGNQ